MSELLLCSAGLGALGPWLDQHVDSARRVAFVDAAARPLPAAPFVDDCKRVLRDVGCEVTDLDLTAADQEAVASQLSRSTLVFVTGGYPVYLLEWARHSGFIEHVRTAVQDGALSYVGVSAGAALAGPSMEPLAAPDDPGSVSDYTALGLVDFVVIPHVNRYPAEVFETRRRHWAGRLHLRPLSDGRALSAAEGEIVEVLSP